MTATQPPVLTTELLDQARILAAQQAVYVLNGLQQVSNWSPETLMSALGERFGYPVLPMSELQTLRPAFECISYTECMQRGVLIADDMAGVAYLILSDPFDGTVEDWALRRYGRVHAAPPIALAPPHELQK